MDLSTIILSARFSAALGLLWIQNFMIIIIPCIHSTPAPPASLPAPFAAHGGSRMLNARHPLHRVILPQHFCTMLRRWANSTVRLQKLRIWPWPHRLYIPSAAPHRCRCRLERLPLRAATIICAWSPPAPDYAFFSLLSSMLVDTRSRSLPPLPPPILALHFTAALPLVSACAPAVQPTILGATPAVSVASGAHPQCKFRRFRAPPRT
ncbi:hypothetical protein C8R45DRAFT_934069 [Mycena sanguinolenta]|nr:hypothetical protein C8R45DRAFT_934069 [Mycena sanguinolenta]